MYRLKIVLIAVICMSALTAIVVLKPVVANAARPTTCGTWSNIPSPNVSQYSNYFNGVAVISANNVWAVGNHSTSFDNATQTLTVHWNGQQWSVVPSPNATKGYNFLNAVAAISSSDVWAVGSAASNGPYRTLIEHWNGAQWSIVSSPKIITYPTGLMGVAAISSNDIWAVGGYSPQKSPNTSHSLIEHWNGAQWSVVSHPEPSPSNGIGFSSITAISANNIWAVGGYGTRTGGSFTLFEHWNGQKWSIIPSPSPNNYANVLRTIAADSANDIWAVGYQIATSQSYPHSLIEHWDGSHWSVIPAAPTINNVDSLYGVTAFASNNAWAVGEYAGISNQNPMLIEHWNGKKWSVVSGPKSSSTAILSSVARIPGTTSVWAVGNDATRTGPYRTLTVFYC
jgi:hypothetical protein